MQTQASIHPSTAAVSPPPQKQGNKNKLIALGLCVVLGLAGAFGAQRLTGKGRSSAAKYADILSASGLQVDAHGNNLTGNHLENLQNGGLITMQGDAIFFADLSGDGGLACVDGKGDVTKITDFPVANLNISGNRMMFTDLTDCRIQQGTDSYPVSAESHQELWELAGSGSVRYGGNLYVLRGVKDFYEGRLAAQSMELIGLEAGEDRFQSVVMTGGTMVAIISGDPDVDSGVYWRSGGGSRSNQEGGAEEYGEYDDYPEPDRVSAPGRPRIGEALRTQVMPYTAVPLAVGGAGSRGNAPAITPTALQRSANVSATDVAVLDENGRMKRVTVATGGREIVNAYAYEDGIIYAELTSHSNTRENIIVRYDLNQDKLIDQIDGSNLKVVGTQLAFVSNDDALFIHTPNTDRFDPVAFIPCSNFQLDDNGNIVFITHNEQLGLDVNVMISRQSSFKLSDEDGTRIHPSQRVDTSMGVWNTYVNPPSELLGGDGGAQYFGQYRIQYNLEKGQWMLYKLHEVYQDDYVLVGPLDDWTGHLDPSQAVNRIKWQEISDYRDDDDSLTDGETDSDTEEGEEDIALPPPEEPEGAYGPDNHPTRALEALMLSLQGYDYNDHGRIGDYYSSLRWQSVLDYYGPEARGEYWFAEFADMFASTGESELGVTIDRKEIEDCVRFWMRLCEFRFDGYTTDDQLESGTVTVTITRRVDLEALFRQLMPIYMQAINEYPGGQAALRAQGEEHFSQWATEVIVNCFKNPEEYGMLDTEPHTFQIEMDKDAMVGFVVDDIDDVMRMMLGV